MQHVVAWTCLKAKLHVSSLEGGRYCTCLEGVCLLQTEKQRYNNSSFMFEIRAHSPAAWYWGHMRVLQMGQDICEWQMGVWVKAEGQVTTEQRAFLSVKKIPPKTPGNGGPEVEKTQGCFVLRIIYGTITYSLTACMHFLRLHWMLLHKQWISEQLSTSACFHNSMNFYW